MKLLLSLLIFSAISSCSTELPHERVAFSVSGVHGDVEFVCSGGKSVRNLGVLVEYRKQSGTLFAAGFDGNGNWTDSFPIEKNETCSFRPITVGSMGGDTSKYSHPIHAWLSNTKKIARVCINQQDKKTYFEAMAVLEVAPRAELKLATQTTYIVANERMEVLAAFFVPQNVAQDFPGFQDAPDALTKE